MRHHLADGLDEVAFEAGRDQGDEVDEVAPVRVVGVALERDGLAEPEVNLADCQRGGLVAGWPGGGS